ncbi:ABC transporter permease [Desulfotruncus alcoholivorax]|uniref:ABC transporter permease n=1 Tax=Desulfotruncus alcoholivorax TaxID=265477 RepID=UPI0004101260|nr:ABC transporter permease [Desulfotruncus alcoholivorax]
MLSYLIKRLLYLIPVLFGVSVLVFGIMHLAPGDPAQVILGPKATAQSLAKLRAELGLDQPVYKQYLNWMANVLQGDWGRSIQMKREVLPLVAGRFLNTLVLTLFAALLAISVGLLAGIVSATRQYSVFDRVSMVGALVGFCLPVFWLGIILQFIFGLKLNMLPVSGMHSPGHSGFADMLPFIILPAIALSAEPAAVIARMTRSSILEVIRQDYIRTARAKGLSQGGTIWHHALKNALIPVVTVVGMQIGYLLAGAVLVEMVFSWPGIGTLMVNGIIARDFPLVQGIILLVSTSYVLVNLLVDILYTYLDPRITYD